MKDVAKAFKIRGFTLNDNPTNIQVFKIFLKPCLLNINTNRIYWHAGAGKIQRKHLIDLNLKKNSRFSGRKNRFQNKNTY